MVGDVIQFSIRGSAEHGIRALKSLSGAIKKVKDSTVTLTKTTAIATAGLVAFVKINNDAIDATAKFGLRIGKTVEGLSSVAYAAQQAGISTSQFNMATQRMVRRVSEAAVGLGEAKTALLELGIDAKEFNSLGLEDQYAQLAESIGKVQEPSDKLRLAFKLFDSEGTAVLQMLAGGSDAMREMSRDAAYLGLVIDSQTAVNAEAFGGAMTRATGSLKGLSRGISAELTPAMTGIANSFANFVADNRDAVVNFVKSSVVNFFTLVEVVKQVFHRISQIFSGNTEALASLLSSTGNFVVSAAKMFLALGKAIAIGIWEGIKAAVGVLTDFGTWLGNWIANTMDGKVTKSLSDSLAEALVQRFSNAFSVIKSEVQEPLKEFSAESVEAANALGSAFGVNLEEARNKAVATIQSISEFGNVVTEQTKTTGEGLSELMLALNEQQNLFMASLSENSKTFATSLYGLINTTVDGISTSVAQAIVYGKSLSESFSNLAKQVLSQFISILVKMGIQRLALSVLQKTSVASEGAAEGGKAVGMAAANAVASTAAAPWPINLTAPAVGAAMGAAAATQLSAGIAVGKGIGALVGAAHGGLTNVPSESTYLLDKGERIISPNQNTDLTNFLSGSGGGTSQNVTIANMQVEVLPNATNAEALFALDKRELEEFVAGPIIDALNTLDAKGVRPDFVERRGV